MLFAVTCPALLPNMKKKQKTPFALFDFPAWFTDSLGIQAFIHPNMFHCVPIICPKRELAKVTARRTVYAPTKFEVGLRFLSSSVVWVQSSTCQLISC